jgi:hypothetical protein
MSPSTAIILHPHVAKHVPANSEPCLENRGPAGDGPFMVRHSPGFFLGVASFEEFVAHRERYCNTHDQRRPKELENWEIEALAARRIIAIVDNTLIGQEITWDQLREIRWRALIAQPHCMSDWLDDILND